MSFTHPDRTLDIGDLLDDPIAMFRSWLGEAETAELPLPNTIALATAGADGAPAVRHVLLRTIDDRGFVFFTNRGSRKGRHLAENPRAAFSIVWKELDRQISVTGSVTRIDDAESDAYFATRSRDARIGAWASRQSSVLADRAELEASVIAASERFGDGEVPRPPHWGGYRIHPDTIEFWQGRAFRLHDRFRYTRDETGPTGWRVERLAP